MNTQQKTDLLKIENFKNANSLGVKLTWSELEELASKIQEEASKDGEAKKVFQIYNMFHQIIDDQEEMYQWFRKEMKGEHEQTTANSNNS